MQGWTIHTKKVMKDGVHVGWKVTINGVKYPRKSGRFYGTLEEKKAVKFAMADASDEAQS